MALNDWPKKETLRIGLKKEKGMLLPGSLAYVECLSMPLVQEVVLSADIRCTECQKRVAEIMSRMNNTESVLINVLEKNVTLTCRYEPRKQVVAVYRNPLRKLALIKRIFRSTCN
ncbi:uncharacterized protein [Euphorbia lathyris]|uniref:uncharacterized protein isoform X1 n=1 Tax=Euphorbia lathyris TaxID=212925 RepID=UPI0033136AEA